MAETELNHRHRGERKRYRYRYRVRQSVSSKTPLIRWSRRATYVALGALLLAAAAAYFALKPKDVSRAMERAQALHAKGDNAAAQTELQKVLAVRDNDHAAFFLAGKVLAELGDLVAAEGALRRALEHGHAPDDTLPLLGRVLLELEKYDEVIKLLGEDVQPGNPLAPQYAVLRGRAYLGHDEFAQAETQFRLSQSIRPSAAATVGLALVAMGERDRQLAERLVGEALKADPQDADALMLRAELARFSGRVDEAAKALAQAVQAHPNDVAALSALSLLELGRDRLDAARPLMQQLQKLSPRGPRPRFAAAMLAFKEKRFGDALLELRRLAAILPNHPPGLLLTGMVQYAEGRYDQAQNAFGAYLKRYPGDAAALRMLGATLLAKGQPHLAVNVFAPYIGFSADVGLIAVAAEAYRQTGRFAEARSMLQRAIAREPKNPDLHTNLALVHISEGARAKAIPELEAAIALNPPHLRADEALLMTYLALGRLDRAEHVAASLGERAPKSAQAFTLKAAVQMAKRDFAAARQSLEQALVLDATNLEAVEALGTVDAAEAKPDSRRERLEAIVKRDPTHAGALLALAKLDLALGRHAQSVAFIRQSLAAHPQSINALLMLADVQFRQGQIDEAVITARQATHLHPDDTRAIALLAEALMAKGDKEVAIETLAKLVKKQPEVISGYLRLAAAYLAAGDPVNARATALAAFHKDQKDRGARALLADIYLQTGAISDAIALAVRTQKEDPQSALGYRMEGDIHLARKDYVRAAEAYRKAASLQLSGAQLVKIHQAQTLGAGSANDNALRSWVANHPEDVETRLYLADALSAAGRYAEAADHYRQALQRQPSSARALNNLAWALHSIGDKSALQYARRAVQLAPTNAATLDTLGWILVQQGNPGEGVPALLKATSIDSGNPEIRYHLAQSMLKIGDTRRAKAELRTLLESKKPFRELPEARALAAKLGP